MIFSNQKILYLVKGLNFKKFLDFLKKENINVFCFRKIDFKTFEIALLKQDEKTFLNIANKFNYKVSILKQGSILSIKNKIKSNFSLFLTSIFLVIAVFFASNFVFKIEVFGCTNLLPSQIINVLEKNNVKTFKFKKAYNLRQIANILQKEKEISFASVVIRGNTMIVNINEKIDNSSFVYDYPAITVPFDCIIKSLNIQSGSTNFKVGDVLKKGQEIVMPYVLSSTAEKLSVPAKAEIELLVELSHTTEAYSIPENEIQNIIEQNKKILYTELGNTLCTEQKCSSIINKSGEVYLITTYLKAVINL